MVYRLLLALFLALPLYAKGTGHGRAPTHSTRTRKQKIVRSLAARKEFMRKTGYPHGRPGYIIDHVKPLCKGGPDTPENMNWQTKAEAKAKDKIECK